MKGLYRINREGQIRKAEYSSTRVVSEQIRGFVEDDEQNIWFGTFDGLQVYNPIWIHTLFIVLVMHWGLWNISLFFLYIKIIRELFG